MKWRDVIAVSTLFLARSFDALQSPKLVAKIQLTLFGPYDNAITPKIKHRNMNQTTERLPFRSFLPSESDCMFARLMTKKNKFLCEFVDIFIPKFTNNREYGLRSSPFFETKR